MSTEQFKAEDGWVRAKRNDPRYTGINLWAFPGTICADWTGEKDAARRIKAQVKVLHMDTRSRRRERRNKKFARQAKNLRRLARKQTEYIWANEKLSPWAEPFLGVDRAQPSSLRDGL